MKKVASAFGRMGGKANYEKNGVEHMKAISKLAAAARNRKRKEASKKHI